MALQRISGTVPNTSNFPISPVGANVQGIHLVDWVAGLAFTQYVSEWTLGATAIWPIPFPISGIKQLKLLSFSLRIQLGIMVNGAPFGKLGKIRTGLLVTPGENQTLVTDSLGLGFNNANPQEQSLPTDPSLVTTIFDPAVDPLPPIMPGHQFSTSTLAALAVPFNIFGVVAPPLPIPIDLSSIAAGLWIDPSLIGMKNPIAVTTAWIEFLYYGTWSAVYDDGS